MQICLIGPSYPFRGGLAHYTTLLYRHLRRRHPTTFYAFHRQYPQWLFPGETDRDNSRTPLQEEGILPALDSLNPLTWWHVARKIGQDRPDLLIIPWWSSFWAPHFWTIAKLVQASGATEILFICHNVVDHESHALSRACARAVLRQGDYFLVHSESDRLNLRRILPHGAISRVFHPSYDVFRVETISQAEARKRLNLAGEILLFFGFVRPYKGLDNLLEAMPLILAQRPVTLLIVGEFWEGRERYRKRIDDLGIAAAVRIVDEYIPNEQVEPYVAAADLVVLPYVSGTGSGIVQIAYGCLRPVVATTVGCFPEVVEDGKTGYLVPPGAPQPLSDAIVRFFAEGNAQEFVDNIRSTQAQFSWDHLVASIEALGAGERRDMPMTRESVEGV